jgi:hypothetical protein
MRCDGDQDVTDVCKFMQALATDNFLAAININLQTAPVHRLSTFHPVLN